MKISLLIIFLTIFSGLLVACGDEDYATKGDVQAIINESDAKKNEFKGRLKFNDQGISMSAYVKSERIERLTIENNDIFIVGESNSCVLSSEQLLKNNHDPISLIELLASAEVTLICPKPNGDKYSRFYTIIYGYE